MNEIFSEYEKEHGIKVAEGVHWKNGRFVYDSKRVYLRRNFIEITWICIGILGLILTLIQ